MKQKDLPVVAWVLSSAVVVLAIVAWGDSVGWRFDRLNAYALFPLFGILAFSLMWAHYIMGAVRRYAGHDKEVLRTYFNTTSALVLYFLLLHPGLLIWRLQVDGYGVPPASYKAYVGEALYGFVLLGFIAFLTFITYELRRLKFVSRYKKWLQYASDIAMMLVFVHGLKLGSALHSDWFRAVWLLYGILLVMAIIYTRWPQGKKT